MDIFYLLSALFIDRASKNWAKNNLSESKLKTIVPNRLYFMRVRNYGFSQNVLSNRPETVKRVSALIIFVATLYYLFGLGNSPKSTKSAFSLMLGGGISNLADRLADGYVTDFVCFKEGKTTVFNLADFFIFIGVFVYAVFSFFEKE